MGKISNGRSAASGERSFQVGLLIIYVISLFDSYLYMAIPAKVVIRIAVV